MVDGSNPRASTCRGCGASIRWIQTVRGRPMPADAELVTIVTAKGYVVKGYMVHWASCPNRDQFVRMGMKT